MSLPTLPTYEQLSQENALLRKLVEELRAEVAALRARLDQNSKNSSKPPSTDQKPNLPASPKKGHRPYHSGANRQLLPESAVTSREVRSIEQCPRCRSEMISTDDILKWQQIELPPISPLVHQIELVKSRCPCCHLEARPELTESEKFLLGPRLEAFVNLLLGQYRQGHRPVRAIIATILPGVVLSQGLIAKIKARAAVVFSASYEELMEAVTTTKKPLHVDATGWRHMGMNEHALVLRVNQLIAYAFVERQNGETIANLLGGRVNHLVTDRGLACGQVEAKVIQYCLAHLLRNVRGQAEHPAMSCEDTQRLGEVYDLLQELFIDKHRAARGELSESTWRQYGYEKWRQIKEILEELVLQGGTKKLRRFCTKVLRELKYFRAYLKDPSLPMTNNPAEEALRNLVIVRKLCFGSRSTYGKAWRAILHSCIETLCRQGRSVLAFLTEMIQAFRSAQPGPSLLPT